MKNKILILVFVVMIAALGYFAWSKNLVDNGVVATDPGLETFTNEQYGFSFKYPKGFEVGDDRVNLPPNYEEFIPAKSLTRKIPIKHCGLSGLPEHCTDFTNNPKITITVINGSLEQITKEMTTALGEPVKTVVLAERDFKVWTMGVEGEGENRYFTRLTDGLTLMFAYSYLDGNMLLSYKDAPNFWDLAQQQMVFEGIISSLNIK